MWWLISAIAVLGKLATVVSIRSSRTTQQTQSQQNTTQHNTKQHSKMKYIGSLYIAVLKQ